MSAMASQITSFTIVYATIYSGTEQRKHQSSASLAFVRGISPHRGPVTRKFFSNWWRYYVQDWSQANEWHQDIIYTSVLESHIEWKISLNHRSRYYFHAIIWSLSRIGNIFSYARIEYLQNISIFTQHAQYIDDETLLWSCICLLSIVCVTRSIILSVHATW